MSCHFCGRQNRFNAFIGCPLRDGCRSMKQKQYDTYSRNGCQLWEIQRDISNLSTSLNPNFNWWNKQRLSTFSFNVWKSKYFSSFLCHLNIFTQTWKISYLSRLPNSLVLFMKIDCVTKKKTKRNVSYLVRLFAAVGHLFNCHHLICSHIPCLGNKKPICWFAVQTKHVFDL